MVTVTFLPGDAVALLDGPTPLSDLAAQAEILIDHPCGANATCGKCRVRFVEGAPRPTPADERLLSAEDLARGWRLACQAVVEGAAVVEVPPVARLSGLKTFGPPDLFAAGFEPRVRRLPLTLRAPDLDHQVSLLEEIQRAAQWAAPLRAPLALLRDLPVRAWQAEGRVTAVIEGDELIDLHPGSSESPLLGVAVDLGSTSVAAALVDLETGAVVGIADALNPQVRMGADVIARIDFAQTHPDGNERLHRAAMGVVGDLIRRLGEERGVDPAAVVALTIAGNPAMLHTFLGVDVRPLGQAPYVGAWVHAVTVKATELGLPLHPNANVHVFPMIRSNVGGDTVAAAIAAGLDATDELTLLIDLGTNSEIVLGHRRRAIATSTAAGPAFEGANIGQGMRAAPGAIDRVSLCGANGLRTHVIGGVKARGLCGTGLIDAAAALLAAGLVDVSGRMVRPHELHDGHGDAWRARLVAGEHGHPAVVLAPPGEGQGGVPVMITAHDIRQLQLIKGSIMAGAQILLDTWGARWSDVQRVAVTGAFGAHVRKASALAIGLLPPVDPERIVFIGNAAGTGARMALVDRRAWERAVAFARRCEYLELGFRPEYQWAFAEAMRFPEPKR